MSSQALAAGLSSFGSSIGQGFQNYMAGREKRELLSGEAMAIYNELGRKGVRTQDEQKMFDKLEKAGDMGTRELQSIISEYETGEKMEQFQRSKRLQELQIRDAERREKSALDLMRFGKSIPERESEFTGPSFGQFENVPAYLLDPSKRQVGDPMIPSYDQDSPVQGPSMAMYEDIEKVVTPQPPLPPKSISMGKKEAGRWLDKQLNIYKGAVEEAQKELDAHIEKYKDSDEFSPSAKYISSTVDMYGDDSIVDDVQSGIASFLRDQYDDPVYQKSRDLSRRLDRARERVSYLEEEKNKNEYLPPLVVKGEEREPLVSYNAEKAMSNLAQDPSYYDPKLDPARLGSEQVTGSFLEDAGDTLSDRRDKLVSALSDYSLTPQDRKQALDLIGEKYPKLKEVAAEAVSPSGDKLGFTIGGKFIPAKSSVTGVGVGTGDMEISSLTVNDKGEVTKILKPKEKLKEAQKTLLANAKEFKHQAKELLKVVDSHGGWESSLSAALSDSSAKAKADLDSLSYRMAILYSKIVDPATAAREGEVIAAKKYAFPMGFWVPNSVTIAAVNSMLEEVMRRESNFYETEGMEQPEEATPSNSVNNSNPLGY